MQEFNRTFDSLTVALRTSSNSLTFAWKQINYLNIQYHHKKHHRPHVTVAYHQMNLMPLIWVWPKPLVDPKEVHRRALNWLMFSIRQIRKVFSFLCTKTKQSCWCDLYRFVRAGKSCTTIEHSCKYWTRSAQTYERHRNLQTQAAQYIYIYIYTLRALLRYTSPPLTTRV